jgi:uncharacterized C2H2 Zn-finger protein
MTKSSFTASRRNEFPFLSADQIEQGMTAIICTEPYEEKSRFQGNEEEEEKTVLRVPLQFADTISNEKGEENYRFIWTPGLFATLNLVRKLGEEYSEWVGKICRFDRRAVKGGKMPDKKAWFLDPVEAEEEQEEQQQKMTSPPLTFQCEECEAEFKSYVDFIYHVKKMHEQDKKAANLKVFGGKLIEEEE